MDLPVRIVDAPPDEPVISVDGAFEARGLNLSHWPGNTTPGELRHDLSSGSALLFGALPEARREELAASARAIVNNHYDTDGACALFAVRHPEAAAPRSGALLAAARCGDFYQVAGDEALEVDAIVGGLVDPRLSPLEGSLQGLADLERHQVATDHLMDSLGAILDGDREPYRALWEPALGRYAEDRAALEACARDDVAHLDWTVWTAREAIAPGRHALFSASGADRALMLAPRDGGVTVRLVVSTLSWFDLVSRAPQPRPDLEALADRLNELEGTDPGKERAWRAQPATNASPELWFGERAVPSFVEHNEALWPSGLDPARIRREVAEALRGVLVLP